MREIERERGERHRKMEAGRVRKRVGKRKTERGRESHKKWQKWKDREDRRREMERKRQGKTERDKRERWGGRGMAAGERERDRDRGRKTEIKDTQG